MSVFSFPRLLLFAKPLEIARLPMLMCRYESGDITRCLVQPAYRTSTLAILTTFLICLSCLCSANSQQSRTVSTSNAATRRRQYACHRFTFLLRVAYASRVKRCTFAAPLSTVALATGAIIDAENRARDSEHYRGNSRGHTLSVITYSVKSTPPPLVAARGKLTEMSGHRRGQRSSTRSAPARIA